MSGKTIFVLRPFKLLLNEVQMEAAGVATSLVEYAFGRHDDVPTVIADHPYAKMFQGTEEQVGAAIVAPTPGAATGLPTVPLADLEAALNENEGLKSQVSTLQGEVARFSSQVSALENQVRVRDEALAASDEALTEANQRIRTLAVSLQGAGATAPENTAPVEAPAGVPPAETTPDASPPAEDNGEPDEAIGDLVVKHKGAGKYAVFRDGAPITEAMSKPDADDKALEIAAADALLRNPPKAEDMPLETPPAGGEAA